MTLPERVADDDFMFLAALFLFRQEDASQDRLNSQHGSTLDVMRSAQSFSAF